MGEGVRLRPGSSLSRHGQMKPEQLEIERLRREISLAASDRLQCHITCFGRHNGPGASVLYASTNEPWILAAHSLWAFHQSPGRSETLRSVALTANKDRKRSV